MSKILLAGSVGGLKATVITAATFYAAKDLGHEVVGMAGSSGGAIPLPMLSKGVAAEDFCKAVMKIPPHKLKETIFGQYVLDQAREKIPFLPKRKGHIDQIDGVLTGNGLKFALRDMYKTHGCNGFFNGNIPFVVIAALLAPVDPAIINPDDETEMSPHGYVFSDGECHEAIRCSASIPGVFRPYKIPHVGAFVDGGTVSQIPVLEAVQAFGPNYDVVMADATPDIFNIKLTMNGIKNIVDVLIGSATITVRDSTLQRIERARQMLALSNKRIHRIAPQGIKIKMFDTPAFGKVYNETYPKVKRQLEAALGDESRSDKQESGNSL